MTKEELSYIKRNSELGPKKLAEELGYSASTVGYHLHKMGIYSPKILRLSDTDSQFIKDNYLTMTYPEIGEKLGLTAKQVSGWIVNHIKDRQSKRRVFNEDYFENIDSPNKAYWLGFIYADGWITKWISHQESGRPRYNYEFGIELQRNDEYLLHMLNNELGGVHEISHKHNERKICTNNHVSISEISKFRVYSKKMVEDLHNNGIDFNKTYTGVFPIVNDDLFIYFLRGYIDGDGCIYNMKPTSVKGILGVQITSCTRPVLEYINDTLDRLYGIRTSIYTDTETRHRIFWFSVKNVQRLLDLLYEDEYSPRLERKYEKYKNFYGLAS